MTDDVDRHQPPAGTVPARPAAGAGPALTPAFLDHYGPDAAFVQATADLLTWRFTESLIRSGRLPADVESDQRGSAALREALEALLLAMSAEGLDKPVTALMQSAVGAEDPRAFLETAGLLLGRDRISDWFECFERRDAAAATALLRGR